MARVAASSRMRPVQTNAAGRERAELVVGTFFAFPDDAAAHLVSDCAAVEQVRQRHEDGRGREDHEHEDHQQRCAEEDCADGQHD